MHWQDIIFSVGSVIFIVSLIPAIRSAEKPPVSSSLMTGGTLLAYVGCYATLGLTYSAITGFGVAAMWLTIAFQKARQ